MEFTTFEELHDRILSDIKRHSLIPIVGSGFSQGCKTKNGGVVPSGMDYKLYMIDAIKNSALLSNEELKEIETYQFSKVSEIYNSNSIIPKEKRRAYLKNNFKDVKIDDVKKRDFLDQDWDYIYTLNIDDAIEQNSRFSQVIYSNREIFDEVVLENPSVIKLHGDIDDILKYKDGKSEIFDIKEYAVSPETNSSLLSRLKHDFEYHNLIFIGCSLDDEFDLAYLAHHKAISSVNRYYCFIGKISKLKQIQLEKYGITHCVEFDDYDCIYINIAKMFREVKEIQTDDLYKFLSYRFSKLDSGFEQNCAYLFQGKSLFTHNNSIVFPNFFINRSKSQHILRDVDKYPLQILHGQGCSGKTYIGVEVSSLIRNRDVYYFESKNSLSYLGLLELLNKKNSFIVFDDHVLSNDQLELLFKSLSKIRLYNTSVLLIATSNDNDLPGLISYMAKTNVISKDEINLIGMQNRFSKNETNVLNSLLVSSSLGIFSENKSIADNLISCSNELAIHNKYKKIVPPCDDVRQLTCLIVLAIKRKLYSKEIVLFDLEEEIKDLCKRASPFIYLDYTNQYEWSPHKNSPFKYVLNAEYWLCEYLSTYIENHKSEVINAFKYIIRMIIAYYGRPPISSTKKDAFYKPFILFDNISSIFKNNANLYTIKDIYEALNDELSSDPNYLHQRAKCYIRLSDISKETDKKNEFIGKAFRDANTTHSLFLKRFTDTKNDKVYISASHALYTKALCLCHMCNYNSFIKIDENIYALNCLIEALSSPYNTYKDKTDDIYNYGDVIMAFVTAITRDSTLVGKEGNKVSLLFKLIQTKQQT